MKTLRSLTTACALCAALAASSLHAQDAKQPNSPQPKRTRGEGQPPRDPQAREGQPGAGQARENVGGAGPRDFNTALLNELRSKLTPEQLKHVEEALQRVGPRPMGPGQGGPQAGPQGSNEPRRPGGEGQPPLEGQRFNDRGEGPRGAQFGDNNRPQFQPPMRRDGNQPGGVRPPFEGQNRPNFDRGGGIAPQGNRPPGPQGGGEFNRGGRGDFVPPVERGNPRNDFDPRRDDGGRPGVVPPMQRGGGQDQPGPRLQGPRPDFGPGGAPRDNFNPPGPRGDRGPGNVNPPFRRDGNDPQPGSRPDGPQPQFRRQPGGGDSQPGDRPRLNPPQGGPQDQPRRPESR